MKKKTVVLTTAVLALVASGLALADRSDRDRGHGPGMGMDPGRMVERLDEHLELSDEQESRIEEILDGHLAAMTEAHTSRMEQMRQLIESDSVTAEQVRALMDAHMAGRGAMHEHVPAIIADLHAELTPQQRTKAFELLADHGHGRNHGGWRKGRRGGYHHGGGQGFWGS